jgi:hypothetical protein
MKLHNFLLKVTLGAAGVLFAAAGANAGIKGSQHDLGSATGTGQFISGGTTEVCVFCHTPHGSNSGIEAPLWNRSTPGSSYTMYSQLGTPTLDGTELAVGSVSLACLSCHDGSQAMDVVVNAPGSASRTPATYSAAGVDLDAVTGAAMTGTPIPTLGTDLKNDHPISIEYAGGKCRGVTADCDPATISSSKFGDTDFKTIQYASINAKAQYWIDTEATANDSRQKTDIVLYTRTFPDNSASKPGLTAGSGPSVECGSCHDPHNTNDNYNAAEVNFLRVSNADSKVCLACHNK